MHWRTVAGMFLAVCVGCPPTARAVTVTLDNFQLLPATSEVNTLSATLSGDGFLGSSTDTSSLSGFMMALLDFELVAGEPVPTGLTFTGGRLDAEDMSFSLLGGLISATTTGISATPYTDNPPGVILNDMFDAAEHGILLDQGAINAPGLEIDLEQEPLSALGTGQGELTIRPVSPSGNLRTYNVRLTLPLQLSDSTTVTGLPLVGEATIDLEADVTVVAEQTFVIGGIDGDYDLSGTLDCGDIELMSMAVQSASGDLAYDADENGVLNADDITYWIESIRQTIPGDANLDGLVSSADSAELSRNLYTEAFHWCLGDFNLDGSIDGADFNIWNQYKGLSAPESASAVPEPQATLWGLVAFVVWLRRRRANAAPRVAAVGFADARLG